jgi:hypothetical protein
MVDGQMQGHQGRHIERRQVVRKIMSMAVHEVDRPLPQRVSDPLAVGPLRPPPQFLGELRQKRVRGEQLSSGLGSRTGDNQGAVALRDQCPIERGKHLFRTSGSVGTDRRKNIGDIENRQAHAGERKPSSSTACLA